MPADDSVNAESLLQRGKETVLAEAEALRKVAERLDGRFAQAARMLVECSGRVAATGVGKAGMRDSRC